MRLEELVLRHAVGALPAHLTTAEGASGAMMIPIAKAGRLASVSGQAEALRVPGIEDLRITVPLGRQVLPLRGGRSTPRPPWVLRGSAEVQVQVGLLVLPADAQQRQANRRVPVDVSIAGGGGGPSTIGIQVGLSCIERIASVTVDVIESTNGRRERRTLTGSCSRDASKLPLAG